MRKKETSKETTILELPENYELLECKRPGTHLVYFLFGDQKRFMIIFDETTLVPHTRSGYSAGPISEKDDEKITVLILPFTKQLPNEPPTHMKEYNEHLRIGLRERNTTKSDLKQKDKK